MTEKRLLLPFLFMLLLVCSLSPLALSQSTVVGAHTRTVVFGSDEWIHVSIGNSPIESLHWARIDSDIQVYFHEYNVSETIYGQFIIYANSTFSDPFHQFEAVWDGTITTSNQILLDLSSNKGEISVVISKFEGVPIVGQPSMTNLMSIITMEDDIYDVLLDDERFCSFDWNWVTLGFNSTEENSTATNQTFPQIRIYDLDGSVRDTQLITSFLMPFVSYGGVDGVGWMVDSLTASYVKWLLYSRQDITVRPSTGWGAPELAYFNLAPKLVRPGDAVTLMFTLPEGLITYETNLDDRYLSKFLEGESYEEDYDPETKRYTLTFKFLELAKNHVFSINIYAEKHGVPYQSSDKITVLPSLIEELVLGTIAPIVAAIIIIVFFVLFVRWLINRRRLSPPRLDL